ncbi:NAD-specific glutamate dehydrogenase, large form [Caenispirillum salinarum AK4]|uniref:NAD-specific glutamate dehydrogenase, large form n=1 Tax=Caenispirillum salinarum AK4 TaxID=1238182 RepID=K9H1L7_9PROT|nr:NAD-glutamate dehydrogenase [Caenispirillum salinarum]EKV32115.1 NAD-specific glutamate dehydrogenase, large form [Caenispirillum salinarum AK4]
MSQRAVSLKAELVDRVVGLISDRLDPRQAEPAGRFVRHLFRHVPPDDILDKDAEALYGAAMGLWQFAKTRTPGKPKVRVYNPSFEENAWSSDHTIVEIVNDDMPFLVDSVTAELNRLDLVVHLVIHPIIHVKRDENGRLLELLEGSDDPDCRSESVMLIEVTEQGEAAVLDAIAQQLEDVLSQVRAAVADWEPMVGRMTEEMETLRARPDASVGEESGEVADFLKWLLENHYTFLGFRRHDFSGGAAPTVHVDRDSQLGILADDAMLVFDELRDGADLPPDVHAFLTRPAHLIIAKANKRARVHRSVHMDVIGIRRFDDSGAVVGLDLFVGLFTSNVYTNSPMFVPVLRRKIDRIIRNANFRPRSHDGKKLMNILENLPRDELFQSSDEQLLETALGILHLQERQRVALFARMDEFERFVSCLVFVPRDRYDTALRLAAQDILEKAFGGVMTAYYTQVVDSPLARLHFIIRTTPYNIPPYDLREVEARLADAARQWSDHLESALFQAKGEETGARLFRRYGHAFPSFYRERFTVQAAVADIDRIEAMVSEDRSLGMNLYRPVEVPETQVRFKIYHADAAVSLSDILPMLENMGFRVIGEVPFEIRIREGEPVAPGEANGVSANGPSTGARRMVWVHDFEMETADGTPIDVGAVRDHLQEAFGRIWNSEAENDAFNRLVVSAGLSWREVVMLRAYAKYLRQAAFTFSQSYIARALSLHSGITRALVDLFHARFEPAREGRDPSLEAMTTEIRHMLDDVANPDEDRILRRYLNLISATQRTNYYQPDPQTGRPKSYISFKLRSGEVEDLPLPRPWMEVWVYSPRVEAIHLRGGKVARGGIRWSDRREDFRTEILGLMKAQMVKNAVIVPVGSKGGFVVKQPPAEQTREAIQAEGIECYKTFMRGLLDVTDNLRGDAVLPPPEVVRRDDDDPYLVVAADKGTATFSDIANGISQEYGFWLDDAFASGGSQGYDHKAMGITARGGWEAVKRHFREMGHDTQTQDFTVVGVGDMSGDVFGNGMLLSRHIKLVGAFNHLHIFIDPDPDPEKSFEARRTLFETPRSSWADYDKDALSPGAMIYERRSKTLTLTPEIKARFGFAKDTVTPNELMRELLKAEVDLLWFGGIGTYIKASTESNADAGDRTNDSVRVNGRELRAKVVGEGANLGATQRGRVEAAVQAGVRLNTDAIDNSAGVDCSDHEVNIKILLNGVVADGDLTLKQRNVLLEEMTEEVAALVLRDNYLQTAAISIAEAKGVDILDHQQRLMKMLERAGRLDRGIEFLPDDEVIAERFAAKRGLTRPEIAVLMPYSKLWLFDEILESDLPDDPLLMEDLVRYFPTQLQDRYRDAIGRHRLRREIIATHATNSMINRVGGTFVTQVTEKTGVKPADIARAYIITRDAFRMRDLWAAIESLDAQVPATVQTDMLLEANRLIERGTLWVLRQCPAPLDMGAVIEDLTPGIEALADGIETVATHDAYDEVMRRVAHFTEQGVPQDLAHRVANLILLASAPDVTRIAQRHEMDVCDAGRHYFAIGSRFGLGWLRSVAEPLAVGSHWQKLAVAAIIEELYRDQRELADVMLSAVGPRPDAGEAVAAWAETIAPAVERADQLIGELRATDTIDLAMLTVAARQFGTMKGA